MRPAPSGARGNLLSAAKNGAATLLTIGKTRLELLGNEIKEEKLRVVRLLVLAVAAAFCLLIGFLLTVAWLVAVYWEHRIPLLGGFTLFFLVVSGIAGLAARQAMSRPGGLFAGSMAELQEDLRQLEDTADNESKAA